MKKVVIITLFGVLIFCVVSLAFLRPRKDLKRNLEKMNLDGVDNLIIVAHPDDETLWGGAHIIKKRFLIVCVTCGDNSKRYREIKSVAKMSDNKFLALWYPDKTKNVRDDWSSYYNNIYDDLKYIMNYKKWNTIVTHNPSGEYGHQHHKMTNEIVTNIYNELDLSGDLYYFGQYYTKKQLKKNKQNIHRTYKIDKKTQNFKNQKMIKRYRSQKFIQKMFNHMFGYEEWTKYEREGTNLDESKEK